MACRLTCWARIGPRSIVMNPVAPGRVSGLLVLGEPLDGVQAERLDGEGVLDGQVPAGLGVAVVEGLVPHPDGEGEHVALFPVDALLVDPVPADDRVPDAGDDVDHGLGRVPVVHRSGTRRKLAEVRLEADVMAEPVEAGLGVAVLARGELRRLEVPDDDGLVRRVLLVPALPLAHLAVVRGAQRLLALLDVGELGGPLGDFGHGAFLFSLRGIWRPCTTRERWDDDRRRPPPHRGRTRILDTNARSMAEAHNFLSFAHEAPGVQGVARWSYRSALQTTSTSAGCPVSAMTLIASATAGPMSSGRCTGPIPCHPIDRARSAKSGAGSSIVMPIAAFSTGLPRSRAIVFWWPQSLL